MNRNFKIQFKGMLIIFLTAIFAFHVYNKYFSSRKNLFYESISYKEEAQEKRKLNRFNLGQFCFLASDASGFHKIEFSCEIAYYGNSDVFLKSNLSFFKSNAEKIIHDCFTRKEYLEEYFRPQEKIKQEFLKFQLENKDNSVEIKNIFLPVFLIDPK